MEYRITICFLLPLHYIPKYIRDHLQRVILTLYGPRLSWRLLIAIFTHDLGYATCRDIDGPTGTRHPELGARLTTALCDPRPTRTPIPTPWGTLTLGPWGLFTLLHSRTYAAHLGRPPSRLCAADKLAITFEPAYLPRAHLSGEIREYLADARAGRHGPVAVLHTPADTRVWYALTRARMTRWAHQHARTCTPQPGGPA